MDASLESYLRIIVGLMILINASTIIWTIIEYKKYRKRREKGNHPPQ